MGPSNGPKQDPHVGSDCCSGEKSSKATADVQFGTSPGAPISLFGGNVNGKVVSAEPPKKLVTTWQLKKSNWPSDHFATMTIVLDQGSNSTNGGSPFILTGMTH